MAFETACKMAQVVKTVVGRARHVAIVKGLSKNKAATTYPDHLLSARGDLNNLEVLASPESAI